ncbi:MAG: hypothetical protein C3F02_03520 [Parcubacteria group bacterium]|nr:MAG: hypothetical protein C3F02_03520 [Parcubacteria group bacterium]
MKKIYKNIIILAVVALLVVAVIFFVLQQRKQNLVQVPGIEKIYTAQDFPQAGMDASSTEQLVKRVNTDYKYLRDKVDYNNYDIWLDIGNSKQALNDSAGAVEAWEYAIVLDSKISMAYANLANYYKSFARQYDKADYYYNIVINKDNTGYFFDYEGYADLYINYLPKDPYKVESIMLVGADKAVTPNKLGFYRYLYNFWQGENNQEKVNLYKEKILGIDKNYKF